MVKLSGPKWQKKFGTRKRSKYGANKVTHGTWSCDSGMERDFGAGHLRYQELAGELNDIRHHVKIPLLPNISYEVDYVTFNLKTREDDYHEVKGFEDAVWKIKRKLWGWFGPGKLFVWKRQSGASQFYLAECIVPKSFLAP